MQARTQAWALVFILIATLLAALASKVIGSVALVFPGLLLILLVARFAMQARTAERYVLLLGALGSVLGVFSAAGALVEVGAEDPYTGRILFGVVALICASGAGLVSAQALARPLVASAFMFLLPALGFVAINLFYINTYYGLAVLPFWAGAGVALTLRETRYPTGGGTLQG